MAPVDALHGASVFRCQDAWMVENPIVEILIPSTVDDSLAPAGKHVASLFCQHVAPQLPDGKNWDDCRDPVADLMIDTVNKFAPNFKASVIARQIHSPLFGAQVWVGRRRHHARRVVDRSTFLSAAGVGLRQLPDADSWVVSVWVGDASRRRSRGFQDTMQRGIF